MTAIVWMLTWLPPVLSAMSELSPPVNLTVSPDHFARMLSWQPGPGTPTGVSYHVSIHTDKGTSWVPVAGCERVEQPLVCNLTGAIYDPRAVHFVRVVAETETWSSTAALHPGFTPISDTELDLPLLTVTSCGRELCVDLRPPVELQRGIYDALDYKLRIQSSSADGAQFFKHISSLRGTPLADLAPGRQYCVSICISDALESKESAYSRPVCAFTAGVYAPDLWFSAVLCVLLMLLVVAMGLLVFSGFICLRRRPLPVVLTSVHHTGAVAVVAPCSASLTSLLCVGPTLPPAGGKRSSRSSDESDAESGTEETDGNRRDYKLGAGSNLLSSSSSSSLSAPSSAEPAAKSSSSSNHTADLGPGAADSLTRDTAVDLLTLTFAIHKEEEDNERGLSAFEEHDDVPVQSSQTRDTGQVAVEPFSCCAEEEEEDEEEEEHSGYRERPGTEVLRNFF